MENLSTLTGKYGEEGDKLLFKSAQQRRLSKIDRKALDKWRPKKSFINVPSISKRGLRFDLMVPFRPLRSHAATRGHFPFQALPDTARLA